jgi:sensor histidine kinase YesM
MKKSILYLTALAVISTFTVSPEIYSSDTGSIKQQRQEMKQRHKQEKQQLKAQKKEMKERQKQEKQRLKEQKSQQKEQRKAEKRAAKGK